MRISDLTPERRDELFRRFDTLDPGDVDTADVFFEEFGVGNNVAFKDRPFARFEWYRGLLKLLFERSPKKYAQIHKGTPFFFLAWTAFDSCNYETALAYLDAAISEDTRIDPAGWSERPGGQFLRLNPDPWHAGNRTIGLLRKRFANEFDRFKGATGVSLRLEEFLERFSAPLLETPSSRTILSALYVFILEADEVNEQLMLRSSAGGSTGPALSLLFRGGVLFESLLKHLYRGHQTLRCVLNSAALQADFPGEYGTHAKSLAEILAGVNDDTLETAFSTTAKLRNTTGHNLVRDDVFGDREVFNCLVHQQCNALLYVIERKFR